MKKFSITRQKPGENDLLGILFPVLADIGSLHIEEIEPEWVSGLISASNGTITADADFVYSITDVAKYDYVLFPMSKKKDVNIYCGLCTGAGTSILPRLTTTVSTGWNTEFTCYGCIAVDPAKPYVASCVLANTKDKYSILGVKFDT